MKIAGLRLVLVTAFLALSTSFAHAQKTIKIDFDSTAAFTESDGVNGTATKSGLSKEQRAAIIKKVQEKYDTALGAGKVTVSEGTGGDLDIIANGGQAPGALKGKEYGDAGKPGKPGVVHVGEFTTNGFDGVGLTNAIGESIAHEAAHKWGVSHNEEKDPPKLMTTGSKVSDAQRKADNRDFTANDTKILKEAVGGGKKEGKDSTLSTDLPVWVGEPVGPLANEPDDRYLDAYASFSGPAGAEYGYMSYTGEFALQGDAGITFDSFTSPQFMTFIYSAGVDLAMRLDDTIYSLSNGGGFFNLSNPNPYNLALFQTADIYFPTDRGTGHLTLNATVDPTTGGFGACPEPGSLALLGCFGLPGLALRLRRRR